MLSRLRGIAVVLAVVAFGLAANMRPLPAQAAPSTIDDTATFADALRVRTTFGMRADTDHIMESLTNLSLFSEDPLAVPMTVEEAAEVWRRLDIQHEIDSVAVWAVANQGLGFPGRCRLDSMPSVCNIETTP